MENFNELLKTYKLKVTPQRIHILELLNEHGHLSVDQLFTNIKSLYENTSLATIYKNINKFIESGLLMEVKINEEKAFYEIIKEKHSHLYCKECGLLEDMQMPTNNLCKEAQENSSFTIRELDITFYGVCKNCQNK